MCTVQTSYPKLNIENVKHILINDHIQLMFGDNPGVGGGGGGGVL